MAGSNKRECVCSEGDKTFQSSLNDFEAKNGHNIAFISSSVTRIHWSQAQTETLTPPSSLEKFHP